MVGGGVDMPHRRDKNTNVKSPTVSKKKKGNKLGKTIDEFALKKRNFYFRTKTTSNLANSFEMYALPVKITFCIR